VREALGGPAVIWSGGRERTMTTPRRMRGWREAGCFVRATKAKRRVTGTWVQPGRTGKNATGAWRVECRSTWLLCRSV
jgi:hypothetical protein